MERQVLASLETMDRKHQLAMEEQKRLVLDLKEKLKSQQSALEAKTHELHEKETQLLSMHSKSVERENELRHQFTTQLSAHEQQNASLRRQLQHAHSKGLQHDLAEFDDGLI